MSLVGSLEDLGLGDILQIVSLSRKSGVLSLSWGPRRGKILFKDGQVVSAHSSHIDLQTLTALLKHAGKLTPEVEAKANSYARAKGEDADIKPILLEQGLDEEVLNQAIRDHIESLIFYFFYWSEGNFNFELMELGMEQAELRNTTGGIFLDIGLNPQFLAMEGTRRADERRRDMDEAGITDQAPEKPVVAPVPAPDQTSSTPAPEQPIPDPEATMIGQAPSLDHTQPVGHLYKEAKTDIGAEPPKVIILDDDPIVLAITEKKLKAMGISCEGTIKFNEAVERVKHLVESGMGIPVFIVDLFMPRSDGEGILGGLEVIEQIKKFNRTIPVLMISDYKNEMAEKQAFAMGLELYLDKPKRSHIVGEDATPTPELTTYYRDLEHYIPELLKKAAMGSQTPPEPEEEQQKQGEILPDLYDLRKELMEEIGETITEEVVDETPVPSRGLNMLKTMINEFNDPSFSGQITLMVLRFASEFMNRAIIFLVAKDRIAGLGQFGVELNSVDPEVQIRRMRIPLSEPSIFREIVQRRMAIKKVMPETAWNDYLLRQLGGKRPREIFVAPIITGGKIAAILYGDNVPEDKEIGDTDGLEIFLSQAGLAMERALLERRIKEMSEL